MRHRGAAEGRNGPGRGAAEARRSGLGKQGESEMLGWARGRSWRLARGFACTVRGLQVRLALSHEISDCVY